MRKERLRSVVLCCLGLGISLSFLFLSKIIIRLYVAIFEFGASQMEWFRSAKPGGIKLHIEMCQYLGMYGQAAFHIMTHFLRHPGYLNTSLLEWMFGFGIAASGVSIASGEPCLGAQMFSVAASVPLLPMSLLAVVVAGVLRLHLMVMAHLWKELRGIPTISVTITKLENIHAMKENVPFDGPSTYHLAMASLLFMPAVLTLPTTAWFAGFVLLVNFLLEVISFIPVIIMDTMTYRWHQTLPSIQSPSKNAALLLCLKLSRMLSNKNNAMLQQHKEK